MRSASLLILLEGWELNVGLDRRRPKSLASAESLAFKVWIEEAHLEFFRMAEVTASISEYKTCFCETGPAAAVVEAMMTECMAAYLKFQERDVVTRFACISAFPLSVDIDTRSQLSCPFDVSPGTAYRKGFVRPLSHK